MPPKRKKPAGFFAALLPPLSWMTFFYFIPLFLLLIYAFMEHRYVNIVRVFTMENFRQIFTNPGYRDTLVRTLVIACAVTAVDLLLAFPVAYFITFHGGKRKDLLLFFVLLPLWSSYLVRVFAWRIILGYNGVLNGFLVTTHILSHPSDIFLYNRFSIGLTLCYIWLPFMILPLSTAFERLPKNLLEASADLGGLPMYTFRRVTFPQILPGVLAGCISVFSLTSGDYITPTLVGGPGDILVGNLVASQFGVAANWPLGAALAAVMLLILCALMVLLLRTGALESL